MKPIIRVAKLELNLLFYSPIVWILSAILLVQTGIGFTNILQRGVSYIYLNEPHTFPYITSVIFTSADGFFNTVGGALYLYFPLLTMGLISREISSETIKLLYSSPLKARDIVLGKFAAMLAYCLLVIALLGIFAAFSLFAIRQPDTGRILSGLLGLYLLLCAYSAIGLFMSSLTAYQIVAAVATLFTLGLLNYVRGVWQEYDFVRDLTYFLSIAGRTEKMYNGLVTTKDLFYFGIIICMFLAFTTYKLGDGRQTKSFLVRAGRYGAILAAALLIGYITSRPRLTGYYDATATQVNTITPNTQRIVKAMRQAPMEVVTYVNLLDPNYGFGDPRQRNADMSRWERYLRFKPDITFKYVYYYDSVPYPGFYGGANAGKSLQQIAEMYARSSRIDLDRFKTPAEIHRLINLRPEGNQYVMQLKYNGRSTFLRLYDDQQKFPGETETAAALERLLTNRLPKILFVQGHLERNPFKLKDRDYGVITSTKTFRYALINQGFDVDSISLQTQDIPADVTALVLADPRTAPDSITLRKLRHYIDQGGDLLIAGEPGKQALLNPLLQSLGVQLMDGTLVQPNKKEVAVNIVLGRLTSAAYVLSPAMKNSLSEKDFPVSMLSAAALSSTGSPFTVSPLILSEKTAWITQQPLVLDSAEIQYNAAMGDVRGSFPTALALTRTVQGKKQRILVTGDADFMSNAELNRWNITTHNFPFSTALFGWFAGGEFPVNTSRPPAPDQQLNVDDDDMDYISLVFRGLLPALLAISGSILLIRRRRR